MKIESDIEVSPRTGIIIGFVLFFGALLIVGSKADVLILGLQSRNWSEKTAILNEATYRTTSRSNGSGGGSTTYQGHFRYTFFVDGKSYQGRNFNVAGHLHTGLEGKAYKIERRFSEGAVVPVFYNPSDPNQCILKRGIAEDTQVALLFAAFLGLVGAIVLRYQTRRLKNVKRRLIL